MSISSPADADALKAFVADARQTAADLDAAGAEMDVAIARFVDELQRLRDCPAVAVAGERLLVAYAAQLAAWSTARELFPRAACLIRHGTQQHRDTDAA